MDWIDTVEHKERIEATLRFNFLVNCLWNLQTANRIIILFICDKQTNTTSNFSTTKPVFSTSDLYVVVFNQEILIAMKVDVVLIPIAI